MKTELTQHTKSFQRFCALGRALFAGCCILGNYYARNRSTNAKLLSGPRAFLWNTFMGFWIALNLRAWHSPLSSSRKLPRARYNTTSDVKRIFSSHFIRKQVKVLQLLLCFLLGRKKKRAFFLFSLGHSAELMCRYKIIMKEHYYYVNQWHCFENWKFKDHARVPDFKGRATDASIRIRRSMQEEIGKVWQGPWQQHATALRKRE